MKPFIIPLTCAILIILMADKLRLVGGHLEVLQP